VALVTVTYGRRWHLLRQALDAAFEQGISSAIVVDNGSQDDIARLVADRYGGMARVLAMGANTGSARAFGQGLSVAATGTARHLLLLDDDNRLEDGALSCLLAEHARARQREPGRLMMVVGFRPGHQLEIASGAAHRALQANAFLGFDVRQLPGRLWRRLAGRAGPSGIQPVPALALLEVAPYGGMLFDKSLLAEIGLPNPEFVLYADDTEFSYRVTLRGGRLWLVTGARVLDVETSWNSVSAHRSGLARWLTGGSDSASYYALRNRVYFETHHVAHGAALRALNRLAFLAALRWTSRRLGTGHRLAVLLQALRDGEARQLGVKPGLELQ
jgi:cellulose synthase/poly-beta-1,6-N-acetylglucosamine synthase-like glycosyltransferase